MRRSGRTTRTVDQVIQELFTKRSIKIPLFEKREFETDAEIIDPSAVEIPIRFSIIQRELFNRVIERLELEHYGQYEVNKSTGMIKLK